MTSPLAMPKRTGANKIQRIAQALCRAIVIARPLLEKFATDKPALTAALTAALAACEVLNQELEEQFIEYGD